VFIHNSLNALRTWCKQGPLHPPIINRQISLEHQNTLRQKYIITHFLKRKPELKPSTKRTPLDLKHILPVLLPYATVLVPHLQFKSYSLLLNCLLMSIINNISSFYKSWHPLNILFY